jgi:hypothetical protein
MDIINTLKPDGNYFYQSLTINNSLLSSVFFLIFTLNSDYFLKQY